MVFEDLIMVLMDWGVVEFLIPFLLVFTIVFAVLQKTKILGEGRKNFNVVIALIMGLAVVIPHFTGVYTYFDPVDVINTSLPQVSIIVVAIIMLLLIVGVFGNEIDIAGTSLSGIVMLFALVAIVLIFGSSLGWFQIPWLAFIFADSQLMALIIMILVFAVIIWFITKEPKKGEEERGLGKFLEGAGKAIKKKGEK